MSMLASTTVRQIAAFSGLRSQGLAHSSSTSCLAPATPSRKADRGALLIEANKRVRKVKEVVLTKNVEGLGKTGQVVKANLGYLRNYLIPNDLVMPATEEFFASIKREEDKKVRQQLEVKAKAEAMATALQTISKFVIKKQVGPDNQLYASVTPQEVVDAIKQQTGRELNKQDITLPEIKTSGTYEASVKLHPEVTGTFYVVISKDKQQQPAKKGQ